jgi:hypothetical protein
METIEAKQENRFRFLYTLYEQIDGIENVPVNMYEIGEKLSFDEMIVRSIVEYLEGEGLAKSRAYGGFISGKIAITHKGIREIEDANNMPSKPTKNFPSNIIYVMGDYVGGRKIMGDSFENITDSTIINKSSLQNAFNKIKNEIDQETANTLLKIAKEVEKANDPAASGLFGSFTEELSKPNPSKERLNSFWTGLERLLPTVADLASKIIPLFI